MTEDVFLNELTSEQRKAVLKFDDNVAVTANAGSGKTTMLVSKYLYLQLFHSEKFSYKNIVAITFTKKAASEIRLKIRKTIDKLLEKDANPDKYPEWALTDEQKETLNLINRNLMNLEVGTIHRFCRKLLRDYGYRLELEANFGVLEDAEIKIIHRRLILDELTKENNPLAEYVEHCVHFLGYDETINLLSQLLYKKEFLENHTNFYNRPEDVIRKEVFRNIKDYYGKKTFSLLDRIYNDANNFNSEKPEKITEFLALIDNFKLNYENSDNEKIQKDLKEIRNCREKGNALIVNKISTNEYDKKLIDLMSSFNKIDLSSSNDKLLPNRIKLAKALTELAKVIAHKYETDNKKNNKIDNDSTISLTQQLLDDEEVLRLVQHDYAYVMIDEFQDTDDKQLDIANKLRSGSKTKLFVVGDDKQSIYKFRNADVRVFKNLRESLDKENQMQLNTSFRSSLEINCFINDLFKPLMNAKRSDYDVDYNPITSFHNEKDDTKPIVNLMLYSNANDDNGYIEVNAETQLLKSLQRIINEQKEEKDENGNSIGKVNLNKICILSSSATKFLELSTLLAKKGIDSRVLSGKGFFHKNEVKELIAFLRFMDNPDNDMFLARTLKSAFFNYTDDDLYNICKGKKKRTPLLTHFKEYAHKNNSDRDLKTIEVLEKFIRLSNKLPLSHTIIKIIDDTNWNPYYNDKKERDIVYNNLYKFMGICRSLENRDFGNLRERFDIMEKMFEEDKIGEEVGDMSKTLNLSTIHSAKGMEFDHVIIYDMNMFSSKKGGGRNISVHEKLGINVVMPASLENYEDFATRETIIDTMILDDENAKDDAERIRLYYVALTRAKKTLDLIVSYTSKGKQMSDLWRFFNKNELNSIVELDTDINVIDHETMIPESKRVTYRINVDWEPSEVDDYMFQIEPEVVQEKPKLTKYMEKFDPTEEEINFSATKLKMFKSKEYNKFRDTYIYGMPILDSSHNEFDYDAADGDEIIEEKLIKGTDLGVIFHHLMENINSLVGSNNQLIKEKATSEITLFAEKLSLEISEKSQIEIITMLQNLFKSEFIRSNFSALLDSYKEFELKMVFGTHFFKAVFDAFIDNGKEVEIWDWKTNKITDDESYDTNIESYKLQMKLYALFAFRYKPEIEKVTSRLFFVQQLAEQPADEKWIYTEEFDRDEVPNIENYISSIIGGIKTQFPHIYPVSDVF